MRSLSQLLLLAAILVSALGDSVQAASRRVALVIGQSYEGGALTPLPNPVNDAARMAELLVKYGFDVISCDGIRPGCFNQNRSGLLRALVKLELAVEKADVAFVFYAGHGMESDAGNIVAPTDAEIDCKTWRVKNGVLLDQIILAVNGARQKIIVLDACRNDPIKGCPPIVKRPGFSFKDIKVPNADEFLLVTSTKPGQIALDGPEGGHSPFAKALFDTLEMHPHIFFDQAFNRVAKSVYEATKAQPQTQIPETLARGGAPETCLAGRDCATDPSGAVFQRELSALRAALSSEIAALRKEDHFATLDRAKREMPQSNQGQAIALQQLAKAGYGFKAADLSGISFERIELVDAELTAANLEGSDFSEGEIVASDLSNAGMEFVKLRRAHFIDTKLDNAFPVFADAEGLRISGEKTKSLTRSNWYGANLKGAQLVGADLSGASFALADLRGADFRGAKLHNTLLIGAQFDANTRFEGALFDNTDISSAVGLKGLLTEEQKKGVCARPAHRGGTLGFRYSIIEPIPSSRFSGGYEYRQLETHYYEPYVPATAHLANPRCRPLNKAELPHFQPPIFDERLYGEMGFRLSHKLLETGRRRGQILETVKSVRERVASLVKEEDFLRTDRREIDGILEQMRKSLHNLKKPEFVCLDRTLDLFKVATSGHVEQSDDYVGAWAGQRLAIELHQRTNFDWVAADVGGMENLGLIKKATDPWGEFFPAKFSSPITLDMIKVFREWNARRLELLGGKISLCMFPYLKSAGHSGPYQLEKLTARYWASHMTSLRTAGKSQWKSLIPSGDDVLFFVDRPFGAFLPSMEHSGYLIRGDYSAEITEIPSYLGSEQNSYWLRWDMRVDGVEVLPQHKMILLKLSKDKVHTKLRLGGQK